MVHCAYFDITLLISHQQWLVGDAPFPLKYALKVTQPLENRRLRPIYAYNVSTIRDGEKKFNYDQYKVDHGLFNQHRCSAYDKPPFLKSRKGG